MTSENRPSRKSTLGTKGQFNQSSVLSFLYTFGLFHWWFFLQLHQFQFKGWGLLNGYLHVIREAFREGRLPLAISHSYQGTSHFLGNPETILSPQIALLSWISLETFWALDVTMLYSIGFWGLLKFRKKFNLGLESFLALFLLFNFNGFITSHLAAAQHAWLGYFLFPFLALIIFEWLEETPTIATTARFSLLLFGMSLQGSFHMCIWFGMFVFCLAIVRPRLLKGAFMVLAFSLALCAYRILPALFSIPMESRVFLSGYPTLKHFIAAFISHRGYRSLEFPVVEGVPVAWWWEYDVFLGFSGLVFVMFFGFWVPLRDVHISKSLKARHLDFPMLVMTILSFGSIYKIFFGLPVLNSQRMTSRFIILPVIFLIFLAIRAFDIWIRNKRLSSRFHKWIYVGLGVVAFELLSHSWEWRLIPYTGVYLEQLPKLIVPVIVPVSNQPYVLSLIIGYSISIICIAFVLWIVGMDHRRKNASRSDRLSSVSMRKLA